MLINHMPSSVEIEKAASQFGSIYDLPRSNTGPYRRAMDALDAVFLEIINAFKIIWRAQTISSYPLTESESTV